MACPFFSEEGLVCRCAAFASAIVPSLHEREIFCRKRWEFVRCPWHRARRALGRPLSDEEYVATLFTGG